ncbi:MAG: PAS domain S-box protein [Bdellovibrionales bacterium]|nr:PAS domain S-box protein [Bdellovibrionales bacterium]
MAEIYADSSNWLKYIHPEDLEKVQSEFIRAQNTGVMDVEHRIIRADKTMRWVRTRSFPIHDEEGNLFRMSGIAQDITEFKAVEEELRLSKLQLEERVRARTKDLARINQELKTEIENRRQSESRFRTVTDTVPAIVAVHRGGKYLFVNRATCAITGYSMEELLDMNFWELASPEYQGTLKRRGQARMVGEAPPNRYEIQIFTKSGQPRWLLLSISMIEYEGEPAVLGTGYDITDRRNVELELKRAKEAADAANAAKSEFLANMSHEIRTPISAILGFAEMLKTRATEHNEYSDYANGILRNGQHLLELVNDVLDLSKIEAGEFRVTNSRFSLEEELAVILDMVYARVEEKRLQLKVIYDCPVPREIFSDQTRFRQILINIVGNAIKFTLEGSIGIHVCLNKTGERPMLELRVEDTGVGISGSQQDALFEPFSQGEHTFSRRFGGTGLGLTLARKHARALGGDVQLVRSQPGCGSVFLISVDPGPISGIETVQSFTYSRRQNSAGVRSQNSPLQDYRVLLVEDGIDNQVLFAHFLEDAGAIVDIANDGLEALRIANNKQHDLILMDIQLPELDGYEATRTLRQNHYTKPIVALTAHAMIEERERCLQAGCDDCLTKPIESATLISEVKKWAASGRSAAAH